MNIQTLFNFVATALLLLLTSVTASPFFANLDYREVSLEPRDLFVSSTTCDQLVLGSTQIEIGQVCVGITAGTLTVSYTFTKACTFSDAHVYVGTAAPTDRNPGGFPYTVDNGYCKIGAGGTTVTCTIPVQSSWRQCEKTLYIATHASVSCTVQGSGTAWGKGTCFGGTQGNCAKYWTFKTHCYCPTVSTYPQEVSKTTKTYTSTSTTAFLTSTTVTYLTSSTSEYETSTTITYTTSTTSEYLTSTTVVYTTSTTSLYSTTQYPETVITTTSTSSLPLSSTTYTLTCTKPSLNY